MSRRDNMRRIFVGNLPPDVRTRDLEDMFYKFGKIAFIDLKTRRGPPFAFVEFYDYRDAEEAVRCRDGKDYDGCKLRVEFPRGRERPSRFKNGSGSSRSSAPQRRSKFRVKVSGLPSTGSWQDLKDHMREVGEVCFADVYKGGEGVVEFVNYDDMRYAIRKLNNTKFKSHEGESSYIKLREDLPGGDSRSRSRSPIARRRASPSYSPVTKRRDSHSISRSRSRSPRPRRSGHHKRSSRRARSRSRSRSATRSRSRSVTRSPSASPRSARGSSRGGSRDRSRSRSKSASRSPKQGRSPVRSPRGSSREASRERSRSPSRSASRSPRRARSPMRSPVRSPVGSSRGGSRDRSRSPSKSASRSPKHEKSSPARSDKRSPSNSRSPATEH